jgi:hypothetical protein
MVLVLPDVIRKDGYLDRLIVQIKKTSWLYHLAECIEYKAVGCNSFKAMYTSYKAVTLLLIAI